MANPETDFVPEPRRPSNLVVGIIVFLFILASGIIGLHSKIVDYGRKPASPPPVTAPTR
ncbi:MAG TPA: hypothetical protein VFI96_00805 [Longimicrobiaceae bacterium]|nr:hypothetical protein [Longimicrobiaceae bacterium]